MKKPVIAGAFLLSAFALLAVAQQTAPQRTEEEIKSNVSRARADLRTLHTAIESYKVDWNYYPAHLPAITTPISYVTQMPADVFEKPLGPGEEIPSRYFADKSLMGMPGVLKLAVPPQDPIRFVAYSVGPDGVDDGAMIEYDPTNGIISSGDVIRIISETEVPLMIQDAEIAVPLKETHNSLNELRDAVTRYGMAERALPPTLNALTTPVAYVRSIPEDPFLPGLPLGSVLMGTGEEQSLKMYSVGPDLDDDRAQTRYMPRINTAPQDTDGDVFVDVTLKEIKQMIQPFKDESAYEGGVHPWRAELIRWQEENGGKDNALIWYHDAASLSPGMPPQAQQDALDAIIKGNTAGAEILLPWLNLWGESFELMHRGAEVDFAEGPSPRLGFASPVPNFLAVQMASKAACAKATLSLEEGDTATALKLYQSALRMGADYQSTNGFLISHLIGYAVCQISATSIYNSLDSGKWSTQDLNTLARELHRAEQRRKPLIEALRSEHRAVLTSMESEFSKPESLEQINQHLKESGKEPFVALPTAERMKVLVNQSMEPVLQGLEGDYLQRVEVEPVIPTEGVSPEEKLLLEVFLSNRPNYTEASVRETAMISRLRLLRVMIAQMVHTRESGVPATTMEQLAPLVVGGVPTDPFSGKPVNFSLLEAKSTTTWSVGPDRTDDSGALDYDPTNGTLSTGDVVLRN